MSEQEIITILEVTIEDKDKRIVELEKQLEEAKADAKYYSNKLKTISTYADSHD